MGIPNLLPKLQSITTPVHVRDYAGKRAAVDTYSWMHKGAFNCSKDICEGRSSEIVVSYCISRVNLLRNHGVEPLLVFDGGMLPMKADQEAKRARSRKENLERALEHERTGNHAAAEVCYKKSVDITPALAFALIKVLQRENIEYIVAPYEADAQMAFLAFHNYVDLVITEDSDMIAYGCPKVLFKMDRDGHGVELQYCDLARNKDIDFTNFTRQMVLEMCIMSGCDYLPSLPGLGVKRAHTLMKRMKSYKKVIGHLRLTGVLIPKEYEEQFGKAILTFNHQRVYDPEKQEIVHLKEVPKDVELDLDFVGPTFIPAPVARSIARGELDPVSRQPFKQEAYQGRLLVQKGKTAPQQRNLMTNYFSKKQLPLPDLLKTLPPLPSDDDEDFNNFSTATRTFNFQDDLDLGEIVFDSYVQIDSRRAEQKRIDLPFEDAMREGPDPLGVSPLSSSSSCLSDLGHNFKERKLDIKALPVKRSSYFAHDTSHDVDTKDKPVEGNNRSTDSATGESMHSTQQLKESLQELKAGGRSERHSVGLTAIKRKHVPVFSSTLLGDNSSKRTFCTDVSHVEHYASLAHQSMERFVSTITPYMRSAAGARPSGLRPLKKSNQVPRTRDTSQLDFTNRDFSIFAHSPSSFKPPRTVGLVSTSTSAWLESSDPEWFV